MISVCIVNWNQANLLLGCIKSLYRNPPSEELEVIVVDNASEDDSVALVSEIFPDVRIIKNDRNLGFGAANNVGIETSRGWAVLLLNNDTVVMPGAIDAMAQVLRGESDAAIVGCSQFADLDLTHRHMTAYRRFPSLGASFIHQLALFLKLPLRYPNSRIVKRLLMHYAQDDHEKQIEAAHINGACMLCSRDVLEKIGLFDTELFLFLEDTDLCHRIRRVGYRILYTPTGSIVHFGSQSLISSGKSFKDFHIRSKRHYLQKHYGKLACWIYDVECTLAKRFVPRILNQEYGDV